MIAAFKAGELARDEFAARSERRMTLNEAAIAATQTSVRLDKAVLAALNLPEHAKDQAMVRVLRRYWRRKPEAR